MLSKVAAVVVVLALVAAAPAAGQNRKLIVGDAQLGYWAVLQPPTVRCAGGEPDPVYRCSADTKRILTRSEVQLWGPATLSDSLAGLLTLDDQITYVVNCNFSPAYRGPCWGTFKWKVPGVGVWEGHWVAPVMDLMTYESKMMMVGFGTGGAIDGKQMTFDGGSEPYDWYVAGKIRIR